MAGDIWWQMLTSSPPCSCWPDKGILLGRHHSCLAVCMSTANILGELCTHSLSVINQIFILNRSQVAGHGSALCPRSRAVGCGRSSGLSLRRIFPRAATGWCDECAGHLLPLLQDYQQMWSGPRSGPDEDLASLRAEVSHVCPGVSHAGRPPRTGHLKLHGGFAPR